VADSNAKRKPAVKTSNDPPIRTRSKKPNGVHVEVSEDDDDLPEPPPKKKSSKPASRSKQPSLSLNGEPGTQVTKLKPVGKTDLKRARPKKPAEACVALSEDDDDLPQPPPKRSSKSAPVPQRSALADGELDTQVTSTILSKGRARKKPLSVIEEEEEEEEGPQVDKNAKRDEGMDAPVQPRKRTFKETAQGDTLDADDHSLRKRCKTVALAKWEVAGESSNPASLIKEDINASSDPSNAPISHRRVKAVRGKPRSRKASAAEEVQKAPKSNSSATKRKKTAVQELAERPSKKPKVETTSTDKSFVGEAVESEPMADAYGRQTKTKRT
jgi:hypothetical protein